jgi:A/G-specific adenine glycosylase
MIDAPSPARKPPAGRPDPDALLAWYDRHRRALPWRALPGETADPYRVWLSEIMLQQTTVRAVKPYFERFLALFPTVGDLAAAQSDAVMRAWAGLGYYSRARNLHACAKAVVETHGGRFPPDEVELRTLPGIGAYTAAAIAAIAFDIRAVVVDGNVERVVTRLHTVEEALPRAKPVIRDLADALTPERRPGDFAQAMLDLGATICTPRSPACGLCPWREPCAARIEGTQETFPRKEKKSGGALRRGSAFVAIRADGHVLLRTRPPKGLLGGMAETPTTEWSAGHDPAEALAQVPVPGAWRRLPGQVEHVFTHFPLALTVFRGEVPPGAKPPEGCRWVPLREVDAEALPNVMRKVLAHALER